jgi:hypothetical protein
MRSPVGERLGLAGIAAENGGGDGILMNVETDPGRLGHGWMPPVNVECADASLMWL